MSHMERNHRGREAYKMRLAGYSFEFIRRYLRYPSDADVKEAIRVNMPEVFHGGIEA